MEFKYRGITYQSSFLAEQTSESRQIGLLRRRTAQVEQSLKQSLRKPSEELIYRGVRYTR